MHAHTQLTTCRAAAAPLLILERQECREATAATLQAFSQQLLQLAKGHFPHHPCITAAMLEEIQMRKAEGAVTAIQANTLATCPLSLSISTG